jgi:hypothetical protein
MDNMYANARARQGKNIDLPPGKPLNPRSVDPGHQNDTGGILGGFPARRKHLFLFISRLGKWSQNCAWIDAARLLHTVRR